MGSVLLLLGRSRRARQVLDRSIEVASELLFVQFSTVDALLQVDLYDGDHAGCDRRMERCSELLRTHRVPARSWYDLAHQLTRGTYFELLGQWEQIVAIAEETEPELARRQYKTLRTTLLCLKARALGRLGAHDLAETALGLAVRTCPRGAVDPLIVLEASQGICASLRGDTDTGRAHVDRAIAGCRAIGHQYHERWITRIVDGLHLRKSVLVPRNRRDLDSASQGLLLADVATILGAGHSVDLMAHRTVSLLRGTPLGSRVDVEAQGSCEYQAEPTATCDTMPDGTVALALRGSDRRVTIRVSRVDTIDDIAIIKNVADLLQAAVMRTSDASQDDDDLDLWPKAAIASDEDPVFRSPRMVELLKIATRLAATDLPVLITGETGTGKEIIARLIHEHSRSRRGPFVPFNCSSIARDLVESQLFGHRRGAFTGAHETFGGVIRSAERGTLFLDEVGDLDPSVQPKLLRFLEHGEVHAVGESRPQTVSVRLVAATNADLEALIHQGRFRSDLYYRLGVTKLVLPPLRERKDEIPALASRFVARSARECGRLGLRLGDDFLAALLLYDWPGNIRELVNEIRRVVALAADGDVLSAQQLSPAIASRWRSRPSPHVEPLPSGLYVRLDQTLAQAVNQVEEQFIERALGVTGGRVAEAAQLLGLSRKGLFLKRRRRRMVTATDIDGRQRA
jgi:DNA-binding NtrC family response regulator